VRRTFLPAHIKPVHHSLDRLFIIGKSNWHAITAWADYLTSRDPPAIAYNEIIGVIQKANSESLSALSDELSRSVGCVK